MSAGTIVGAYTAKSHFAELLEKVEAGEEFTITKHGLPVARVVPIEAKTTMVERPAVIQRWLSRADKPTLGRLPVSEILNGDRR